MNPFTLFAPAVENGELWRFTAPGLENVKLCDVRMIVKRVTGSDAPSDYASKSVVRSAHLAPYTIPADRLLNVDSLVSLILKVNGENFLITNVSRGDDMTTGKLSFVSVELKPYGKDSM